MALEDALPPHALAEHIISELDQKDRFREVTANLTVFKPEEPLDLVVGFQVMRESDAIGLGFDLEAEEWSVIEQAAYADVGGVHAAGKAVADALEAWAPQNRDVPPEVYAEFDSGDRSGDVQVHEEDEFSDAVYAQYHGAIGDQDDTE